MKFNVKRNPYMHIYFILALIFVIDVFSEQSIAVLNIKSEQLKPGDCIAVTNFMTTELQKVPDYKVLAWDDVTKMLEHVAGKQALGCDDDKCISEIGGALGVELIVAGDIGQLGSQYLMNIRLIDITKAETLRRVSRNVNGDIGLLINELTGMVGELFGVSLGVSSQVVHSNASSPKKKMPLPRKNGMVLIPAKDSTFQMGGVLTVNELPKALLGGSPNISKGALPVHLVSFTHDFWMDTTEVTQQKYKKVMMNPKYGYSEFELPEWKDKRGVGDLYPAHTINWFDAVLYCNALSKAHGKDTVYEYSRIKGVTGAGCALADMQINLEKKGYRLPTEAEWEYACRAGTTTNYYWGSKNNHSYCWYDKNSNKGTHEVAKKKPNEFGLYDMNGNIEEWCNDGYYKYRFEPQMDPFFDVKMQKERITRGGGVYDFYYHCNSFRRDSYPEKAALYWVGFRTVLQEG